MPMGFPPSGLESALKYRPSASDIFVCSYPKCGTTWLQYIVYLLLHDGRPLPPGESLTAVFPHLEEVGRDAVAELPGPRLIKTHLPYAMTPWHAEAHYLYVARNPFDCAVSFYHHTRGFVKHYDFADGSFDDFFECFIDGAVDFGDYFDNLVPWIEAAEAANVLPLTYEGMKADPAAALATIAEFLGGHAARAGADPAVRERVLRESSFEGMSADLSRWSSERPAEMPKFIRKGIVGDWRNHFSARQARRLVDKFEQRTRGTRAAALWPDVLAEARAYAIGSGFQQ